MYIDKFREIVHTSTLNIPERLKSIDKGYFMVRNHKTSQWEVHHREQRDNTLALILPFDELDNRALEMVKSTRIEYASKIFKEMEENNAKIETEKYKKIKDLGDSVARDIYSYVNKHESKETIPEDSKLFKGVI